MQTLDDKPETIHLYVVREEAPKPQLVSIFLSVVALASLVALSVLVPYQQPEVRAVIRVPAVLLPLRTFTAQVAVIPTGIRTYPATTAHGELTITNGSVIAQTLPAGFKFLTNRGVQVITDAAVFVPSGSASGYGYAAVSAHALLSGNQGNIQALAINQVIGSSVYIRNLSSFSGGRDSYSVKYVTNKDKQVALIKARSIIALQMNGIHYPCIETFKEVHLQNGFVNEVSWRCQFVTFSLPTYMHISSIRIVGKNLLIAVTFTPHVVSVGTK
jgi:hypothetical protein